MSASVPEGSVGAGRERELCVVYLAWGPLGVDPVRDFLGSYNAHLAGAPHSLVVLLNGVQPGPGRDALLAELEGTDSIASSHLMSPCSTLSPTTALPRCSGPRAIAF